MIDTTKLKQVNLNFKGIWNPQEHSLLLKYDAKSSTGFSVYVVPVYDEQKVEDLTLANNLLKKYRNATE